MIEVERIVTVLKPTGAFFDWLHRLPDADKEITLEDLRDDCTTLLIPAFDSPDEADAYLEEICVEVFTNELEGWCDDENLWPKNIGFDLFQEWFDIEHHSMVYDMVDDDLEEDDAEDDEDLFEEDDDVEDDD